MCTRSGGLFIRNDDNTTKNTTQIDNDSNSGDNNLKRTAFQKYFALIEDMNYFERINYNNFLAKGTKIVNDILKRNILKLQISRRASDGKCCLDVFVSRVEEEKEEKND